MIDGDMAVRLEVRSVEVTGGGVLTLDHASSSQGIPVLLAQGRAWSAAEYAHSTLPALGVAVPPVTWDDGSLFGARVEDEDEARWYQAYVAWRNGWLSSVQRLWGRFVGC